VSGNGGRPELPDGWRLIRLGDIASPRRAKLDPKECPAATYIGLEHIEPNTMRLLGTGTASDVRSSSNEYLEGDVLYSRLRPYLNKVHVAEGSGLCSGEFIVLRPGDEVSAQFLGHRLNAADFVEFAGTLDTGDRPRVKWPQLADFEFALPPEKEQGEVIAQIGAARAAIGGALQSARVARSRIAAYRRSILAEGLAHCVAPDGSGDLPDLPEGWWWSKVSDEGRVQLGRMLNRDRATGPHMRPYLRVANVLDDRLDLTHLKEMDFPPGEFERYRLKPGDILLNEGQSPELLGRAAMYRGEMPGLCFQKTLLRFQAGDRVDPEFALLVFRYYLYAGRFRRESRITTGIGHLTGVRFAVIEFPVPPLATQEKIVRRTRQALDQADAADVALASVELRATGLERSAKSFLLSADRRRSFGQRTTV